MARKLIPTVLIASLLAGSAASAQTVASAPDSNGGRTTLWTLVGAGGGFGVGIWAGLHVFDDAVNSDRKVWTTAILSAAAGGILGHLISRRRSTPTVRRAHKPAMIETLSERDSPTVDSGAPALGTGNFRRWLEQSRFSKTGKKRVVATAVAPTASITLCPDGRTPGGPEHPAIDHGLSVHK
jgi:hypothetical protein